MSKARIEQYYREVEEVAHITGDTKESSIRRYFANLISYYTTPKKMTLIDEMVIRNKQNQKKYPDGSLQLKGANIGHWEAKDSKDQLENEIQKKFAIGYPQYNILFEDSQRAILYQAPQRSMKGQIVAQADMRNWKELDAILTKFVSYETPEIREFVEALDKFTQNVPKISTLLKAIISVSSGEKKLTDFDSFTQTEISEATKNQDFIKKRTVFWQNCQQSISKHIKLSDIDEMLVQHILTENIFNTIFGESQFHQENNISRQVGEIVHEFFRADLRRNTTDTLKEYYQVIEKEAQNMKLHQQKQRFLKLIYEEFYKAYNPQGADRLGIVYTPSQIIQFMLKATDQLLEKHFDRTLNDKGVKILDPCTGTGTFVCDIIDYLNLSNLPQKYEEDIFANEVGILPYYIANLNIEYTYKERVGKSKAFQNLAFVDTLDNIEGMKNGHLGKNAKNLYGQTGDLFATFSAENFKRIKQQNEQGITVIIGNPPYNANQQNENDNNKNREYLVETWENGKKKFVGIDQRIKDTFIEKSNAQKTKVYDMYARFYRWAMDRMDKNGIIAFVTNRSFIDSRTFDGFRKIVQRDFQEVWILDTKSDVRANPKIAGTTHNVFGIQTGVCIAFFVRNEKLIGNQCKIHYYSLKDEMRKEEKLEFLSRADLKNIDFERIRPDKKGNWLNLTDNDFEDLMPVCSKNNSEKSIFELASNGVSTNRDEWVYDFSKENLTNKVIFFLNEYNSEVDRWIKFKSENDYKDNGKENNPIVDDFVATKNLIKWSRLIKRDKLRKHKTEDFDASFLVKAYYRPFSKKNIYFGYTLIDAKGQFEDICPKGLYKNHIISICTFSENYTCLATDTVTSLDFLSKTKCLPLYRYENGERKENITDWALEEFRNHYENPKIQKTDIFHYVYAVLHCPEYRQKYEQNLKRDFPRIPLYEDFWKWASFGKNLMDLHLNYENADNYALNRQDIAIKNTTASPKTKLKANKELGEIYIDEITTLQGVPPIAWDYKLGNRSALEWILDQYKESKPSDATIAEKFNTYRFADYKEQVIDLLQRVCTVSVRTMEIIEKMD